MNIQSSLINLPKNIINKKIKRDKIKEIIGNYKININNKFEAKKLDMNDENLLIHDLIPKGKSSTVLTVQMNEDNQKEKIRNKISEEKVVKKKEIKDNDLTNNDQNYYIQVYNNKNNKNLKVNNTNNNIEYENTTFIAYYIKKSNELFLMMKEFRNR